MRKVFIALALVICAAAYGSPQAATGDGMTEPNDLVAFRNAGDAEWYAVNDGVMGGLSQSRIRYTDTGTGIFSGELSLENNGGFASVRTEIEPVELSRFTGLAMRVRGDGRTYQLRLRENRDLDGVAYRAFFDTIEGEWISVRLPFAGFLHTFRGRTLNDEPALDTSRIAQVALLIADKLPGSFALEIEFIRPWIEEKP